jgi:taurine dioxygenase
MSIEIIPTRTALGAEISGVDLAQPLDDATFATIERAYNDHGVIFYRDQRITPPQQVAFTRRFGEIEFNIFGERWSVPGSPEIVVVSNVTEDGRPVGIRRAGENWHSDMCYVLAQSAPPHAALPLHAHNRLAKGLQDRHRRSPLAGPDQCGGSPQAAMLRIMPMLDIIDQRCAVHAH